MFIVQIYKLKHFLQEAELFYTPRYHVISYSEIAWHGSCAFSASMYGRNACLSSSTTAYSVKLSHNEELHKAFKEVCESFKCHLMLFPVS